MRLSAGRTTTIKWVKKCFLVLVRKKVERMRELEVLWVGRNSAGTSGRKRQGCGLKKLKP